MSLKQSPPRRSVGLALERLEARDVPAAFWWDPISPDATTGQYSADDAENWLMGDGAPWDRYDPSDPAPGPSDDVYFDGGLSSASCLIPASLTASSGNAFSSIHLEFGWLSASRVGPPTWTAYSGTVTTADTFAVGTLEMQSGAISQGSISVPSGNGSTLTITSSLSWTGGTLNSNSVAGKIDLAPGATGVAEPSFTNPGIDGIVTMGSTLATDDDAQMTLNEGKYQVNCALGFSVLSGGNLTLAAPVPKSIRPNGMIELVQGGQTTNETENAEKGLVNVKPGGTATARVASSGETGSGPMKVQFGGERPRLSNRGTTIIKEGIAVEFSPSESDATEGAGAGFSQSANDGAELSMEAGTKIVCMKKTNVTLHGGTLELVEQKNGNGVPFPNQSQVAISAPDHAAGKYALDLQGVAELDHPNATVPIPLYIDGAFRSKGDITMYADQSTGKCDTILVEKQIKFDPADLTVEWFVPGGCNNTDNWPLIRSMYSDSTGNTVAISSLPTYHLPPAAGGGLLSLSLDSDSTVINFACMTP